MADDEDDFTYTEDASGAQKKVAVEKEFIFKVVVLGDYSVGKTCLIKRLLAIHSLTGASSPLRDGDGADSDMPDSGDDDDDELLAALTPTVGTDFYSLSLPHVLPGASIRLQIWDTAGMEKYAAKYENTFRNASFVVCVFDVTSASSLHNIVDRHLSIAAEHIPELDQSNIMVVANKIDIIHDVVNNTAALRDARRRAQSPETAFDDAHDDDTATNTDYFTSAKGVDMDAIVTAKNVQAGVFDLFGEVHYAEVSAKTRQNVKSMLQTLAYALLRNSPEVGVAVEIPETESTYDIFAHTVLPMQTPGSSPVRKSVPAAPPAATPPAKKAPLPPTPPPTAALRPGPLDENENDDASSRSPVQQPSTPLPTAPKASWGTTGAFKFDMAPMQFSGTAVFSPIEGSDPQETSQNVLPGSPDIPSATRETQMRSNSVEPGDVELEVTPQPAEEKKKTPAPSSQRPTVDPHETPLARKAREAAEMSTLLGRAGQKKSTPAAAASPSDALLNDADRMEDDVAAGRDRAGARAEPRQPQPSLLDSLGKQDEKNREDGPAHRSDSDEDGTRMQTNLKNRFAQIEHDIRQDNAVAKERAKRAKKAEGKCKCVVM